MLRQPPSYLAYEDVQHTARNDRLTAGAAYTPGWGPLEGRSGALIGPPGAMGEVSLPDQDTVRVGPGIFVLQGWVDAAQGQYVAINDADYDQPLGVTQHASQYRRVAIVVGVLDSVMAGIDPVTTPVLDADGNPAVDADGNPITTTGFATPTNLADVYPVAGDLSPAAPGLPPNITADQFQAYAVLGWVNVAPAGGTNTFTANPMARVGSRTGILPATADDDTDGSHIFAYRHHPDLGLQFWTGTAWTSLFTDQLTANTVRILSGTDAGAASTGHGLQVGPTAGSNIIIDGNEVMARVAGAVSALYLGRPALGGEGAWDLTATSTPGNALATKDYIAAALARTTAATLRLTATADATPTSTGHALQIGADDANSLRFDNNEIVAALNGALASLILTNPVVSGETWVLSAAATPSSALVTKAYVAPAMADTGWVNFVPSTGWSVTSADGGCKYRLKAGVLWFRFACTLASYGAGRNLFTFGTAYRPSVDQTLIGSWGGFHSVIVHQDSGVVETGEAGTGGLYVSGSWPVG